MKESLKTGLVLEGGGLRGMFTCGVLDVLMDCGISFDGAVGVSAGAAFGVNIKSGQRGRALRYNLQMAGDKRYMSLRSLLFTGNLFNAEFCYHTVPCEIDIFDVEAYARNPMEFIAVCTDVLTGEPVYHVVDHIDYAELEWIRASASLPLVAQPVHVDGRVLLDGGLTDCIPLKFMQGKGYERIITVLTQPLGYRKTLSKHMGLLKLATRKYPKVYECLLKRPDMYNAQLDYVMNEAAQGRTLMIAPTEKLDVGRVEMQREKLQKVYDEGCKVCEKMLPKIKEYLESPSNPPA
jgi:predicted patatin/cPLA2 family phospholipase